MDLVYLNEQEWKLISFIVLYYGAFLFDCLGLDNIHPSILKKAYKATYISSTRPMTVRG